LQFSGVAIHFISNAILSSYSSQHTDIHRVVERLAVMLYNNARGWHCFSIIDIW
jgi:hypothetical protein